MSKNILITGAAGFIGFNLAKRLSEKNFNLTLIDNLSRGRTDGDFKKLCKKKNVNFKNVDLTKSFILKKKFSHVFHLASIVGVKNVIKNPTKTLETNVKSTLNLMKSISVKKTKIVFFSTSEVYSPLIKSKKKFFPSKEVDTLIIPRYPSKRDSYLISKLVIENIVTQSKHKSLIFRPHNIYGPRMGFAHVVPELIQKINKKKKCIVYSPNHSRAFCFIKDAIEQIIKLSFKESSYNKIYNIGNMNEEIKILKLANLIKEKMKKDCLIAPGSITIGSQARRVPDMSKTQNQIGKINYTNLSKGLDETIKWYLK